MGQRPGADAQLPRTRWNQLEEVAVVNHQATVRGDSRIGQPAAQIRVHRDEGRELACRLAVRRVNGGALQRATEEPQGPQCVHLVLLEGDGLQERQGNQDHDQTNHPEQNPVPAEECGGSPRPALPLRFGGRQERIGCSNGGTT